MHSRPYYSKGRGVIERLWQLADAFQHEVEAHPAFGLPAHESCARRPSLSRKTPPGGWPIEESFAALFEESLSRDEAYNKADPAPAATAVDATELDKLKALLANAQTEGERKFEALGSALADLLQVVAAQQQQIATLTQQLDAARLASVQTTIADQASEHLHRALTTSAKVLNELGQPVGEVNVGTVTQKGSLTLSRSCSNETRTNESRSTSSEDERVVDIGGELKGIAVRLAGAKLNLKLDTSRLDKLNEETTRRSKTLASESFTGTFEIQYQGVAVRIGK